MLSSGSYPRCGHCGYNLTNATSNRCPECGLLFIEAGVIVPNRSRRRWAAKIVLAVMLILLFPGIIGVAMTLHHRARAAEAQARAAAMRAEQIARFQEQMLNSIDPEHPLTTALRRAATATAPVRPDVP